MSPLDRPILLTQHWLNDAITVYDVNDIETSFLYLFGFIALQHVDRISHDVYV